MEKREMAVYIYLGVLIVAAILAVYLFNLGLTGFAVSEPADLSTGTYDNVIWSGSALELNSTDSGSYISNVLDAGNNSVWNNITWQGDVPENSSLIFQVSSCSDSTCSDANFEDATSTGNIIDLGSMNITSQYLQYRILFSTQNVSESNPSVAEVSYSYTPVASEPESEPEPAVTISLSKPSGEYPSNDEIPVEFTHTGNNITCWYNIYDSYNSRIVSNTTITGCNNTALAVSSLDEGDYTLNIYANGTAGMAHASRSFSVAAPEEQQSTSNTSEEAETPSTVLIPVITKVKDMTLQAIKTPVVNPGESADLNLIVTNIGEVALTKCSLNAGGDYSSWISASDETQDIAVNEVAVFAFSADVPEGTEDGNYAIPLSVKCAEKVKSSEFSVDVMLKRLDFNVTNVERTRKDRVVVTYELTELLNQDQTAQLEFFLYDENSTEAGNASVNQTLSANESREFSTNIPINASLEGNITLSASLNSQEYSASVSEPITLGAPTGFFVLGDDLGTTGNVLAIVILIAAGVAAFFFIKRKKMPKKALNQAAGQ
jgi:hypothetical protein